jgi:hypothetical protein
LAEKNRKQEATKTKTTVTTTNKGLCFEKKTPVPKNMFVDLYSSSEDEVEEGEVVEERRLSESSENSSDNRWTRSGTKNIYIPRAMEELEDTTSDEDYVPPVYNYEPSIYLEKYKGMSWAEIEYYSDSD